MCVLGGFGGHALPGEFGILGFLNSFLMRRIELDDLLASCVRACMLLLCYYFILGKNICPVAAGSA